MSHTNGMCLSVSGIVQGVGFRPFIWRLATEEQLTGQVFNDASGVKIELCCDADRASLFAQRISAELPPLARIDAIRIAPCLVSSAPGFNIVTSQAGSVTTGCAPDAATCADCLMELNNPQDRRYQYPFINCTNCGPRLSIIREIPYDRATTTMAAFALCQACEQEYLDPENRRFHAQPNACPDCGPQCWLETPDGEVLQCDSPFIRLAQSIQRGEIIAIKGIGGVHLACDATNNEAVMRLRLRKQRPHKALALMACDVDMITRYALVTPADRTLLEHPAAPVVLLPREESWQSVTEAGLAIAPAVAPDTGRLGFMLPYSPLHHLLLGYCKLPLVMTSGNRSGEPQAITNDEARQQLQGIADLLLLHNRSIQNRLDDSVVMAGASARPCAQVVRRARGFAPTSLPLPPGFSAAAPLIALGGQLKSTLCLVKEERAVVSQHLGDLHDASTYDQYLHTLALYEDLYDISSQHYVCDLHPEYLSGKYAVSLEELGRQVKKVQHHHAHVAACLGDNQYPLNGAAVLGICLDGTGYGSDHTLWGGEFLYGSYASMERLASLTPVALIGGAQAIRSPWRSLYAQLRQFTSAEEMALLADICPQLASPMCRSFEKMLAMQLNTPLSSSAGRLFDAVAAALGCAAETISYEGQAAIQLEALALQCEVPVEPYRFTLTDRHINTVVMWQQLLNDLSRGRGRSEIALAFHKGLVAALTALTEQLKQTWPFSTVVLSGGVMQNQLLVGPLTAALETSGFHVLTHQQLPANDGGISFGQALIALAQSFDKSVS